jgi:beta propeller repeat protein
MQHTQRSAKSRYRVDLFGYLFSRAISVLLLCITLLSPLTPVLADETGTDSSDSSNMSEQRSDDSSQDSEGIENSIAEEEYEEDESNTEGSHGDESTQVQEYDTQGEDVNADVVLPIRDVSEEATTAETESELSIGVGDESVSEESTKEDGSSDEDTTQDSSPNDTEVDIATNEQENVIVSTTTDEQLNTVQDVVEVSEPATTTIDIEPSLNSASSTDELILQEEELPMVDATSTTSIPAVPLVNDVANDNNRFVFSKQECVSTGEGTFFCTKSETDVIKGEDRVYAKKDVDGDKEIYIVKAGVETRLTHNNINDEQPYYDEFSNTIVWQRLIDGRYQIIAYDVVIGEEAQLTNDRYNNMEPQRSGDVIVWQGWIGNDWEIMYLQNDALTMITDNTTHDIAPSINGNHIVWQSFENGAWKMKVYDIRSKEIQTIGEADGSSIQNPRFVLVYDAKNGAGDIETRGYDLVEGKHVDLSRVPQSVPEEIPDPEQTGEKRALVSPQNQLKSKLEGDEDSDMPDIETDFEDDQSDTLVIPSYLATSTGSTTADETEGIHNLSTEFLPAHEDVVIEAIGTTTEEYDHIPDIVVPLYDHSVMHDDSQTDVATST